MISFDKLVDDARQRNRAFFSDWESTRSLSRERASRKRTRCRTCKTSSPVWNVPPHAHKVTSPFHGYRITFRWRTLEDLLAAPILLDAGHFALETTFDEIVALIRDFLGRHVALEVLTVSIGLEDTRCENSRATSPSPPGGEGGPRTVSLLAR